LIKEGKLHFWFRFMLMTKCRDEEAKTRLIDSRKESSGCVRFVFILTSLACIGGFLFGYDTGVISGALLSIEDDSDWNLDTVQLELIVSITIAGALAGAVSSGYLCDKLGRKPVVLVSSIVFIAGALIMAAAPGFDTLIIGRLVVGVGVGIASMVVPVYLSEAATASQRGQLTALMNFSIVFGQLISCIVAGSLARTDDGWRIMFALAAVPALIQLIGFGMYVPESPKWLAGKGRIDDALASLAIIRADERFAAGIGEEGSPYANASAGRQSKDLLAQPSMEAVDGVNDLKTTLEAEIEELIAIAQGTECDFGALDDQSGSSSSGIRKVPQSDPGPDDKLERAGKLISGECRVSSGQGFMHTMRELFMVPTTRRALMVGCGLQLCQQLSGINTIMYYSATILKSAGQDAYTAIWLSAVVAFFNVCGSFLGFTFVDHPKWGRRRLTFTSIALVVVCLVGIGTSFHFASIESGKLARIPGYSAGNGCGSSALSYCLDCVAAANCGVCTNAVAPGGPSDGPTYSACVEKSSHGDGPSDITVCPSGFDDALCPAGATEAGWLIFLFLCLYLVSFGFGMGPMPWSVNAEIYPLKARAAATSMSTSCNWLANFAVSMTFLSLSDAITKMGAFFVYAAFALVFGAYFLNYLPETRGEEKLRRRRKL
jgi:SP family myo-inositol transporter-like MFS transporter 13